MSRLTLLIALSISLLCACGLKGPLYLQDKTSTPVTITPAAADTGSSSSSESSAAAPVIPSASRP